MKEQIPRMKKRKAYLHFNNLAVFFPTSLHKMPEIIYKNWAHNLTLSRKPDIFKLPQTIIALQNLAVH